MTINTEPIRTLTFDVVGSDERLELSSYDLVVAGYTGRDEASVQHHIDELAAIGIPAPDSVPSFYELASELVTQDDRIQVSGSNSSGEVEPVLIRSGGRLFLSVGSDHTDRDIERSSVADSKAACPKPVSKLAVALDGPSPDWDAIAAHSTVDGADYQRGQLDALRIPTDVLDLYDARHDGQKRDLVMFCGTLSLIDGVFVAGRDWELSITLPDGTALTHTYAVDQKKA